MSFLPTILIDFWVAISSNRRPVLVIIDYWHCYQLFIQWRLKLLIKISYMIFLSSIHSILKLKAYATKKHKAVRFSKGVHQVYPITRIMLSMLSRRFVLWSILNIPSVIYTLWTTFHNQPFIVKKLMIICSRQTDH